jgi:WD40 repeat protein
MRKLRDHAGPVTCLAHAPDGPALATGAADGFVCVYPSPGSPPKRLGFGLAVECVTVGPGGRDVAAASAGRFRRRGASGNVSGTATGQPLALGLDASGDVWLATGVAGRLEVHRPLLGEFPERVVRDWAWSSRATFSARARLLAVSSGAQVGVWEMDADGRPLSHAADAPVTALAFGDVPGDPSALRLALATTKGLALWRLEPAATPGEDWDADGEFWTLAEVTAIPKAGELTAVSFAPGGTRVLAGTLAGVVRAWDGAGRPAGEYPCHAGRVNAVSVSGDGLTAASAGADHRVVIWDLD